MFQINSVAKKATLVACALLIGAFVVLITMASIYAVRDLKLLASLSKSKTEWEAAQAEFVFVNYKLEVARLIHDPLQDLPSLRDKFEIFHKRLEYIQTARFFESLRTTPEFSLALAELKRLSLETSAWMSADDQSLTAALPDLLILAKKAEPSARASSDIALRYFAEQADQTRSKLLLALTQIVAGMGSHIIILCLAALFVALLFRQVVRHRNEAAEASNRMNLVIYAAMDAVIVADAEWNILEFNLAAEQIFGYSAQEAIGQPVSRLIVPDHLVAEYEQRMKQAQDGREKQIIGKGYIKLEAKRADGSLFPVEVSLQAAAAEDGNLYIAFLRDISHRERAKAELEAARDQALAGEKAKTSFLATMSHEIRTPLNGLLGNLSLLNDTPLTAQQKRYTQNMETSGKLLMSHISDVLDITKYDAGKFTLRPVAMSLGMLLQDIIDSQSGAAVARDTVLDWKWIGSPIDWIDADRDRIQHVLMNVIGNAVKFTHAGKVDVTLEAIGDGSEIEIKIRDTGIGMDKALLAQIFDDFTTGNSSYSRDVEGTGLGLGLAQRFVKALGGTIDVKSMQGVGSLFCIRFPITPIAAPNVDEQGDTEVQDNNSHHILLVEDNEINRVVAREMLRAAGHTVTEAHNGREAVDIAQEQSFDLILMDISMPVLDGRAATREIRAGKGPCAHVPIVALTANSMTEERKAYLADGMTYVLTKPLSRALLTRTVGTLAIGV